MGQSSFESPSTYQNRLFSHALQILKVIHERISFPRICGVEWDVLGLAHGKLGVRKCTGEGVQICGVTYPNEAFVEVPHVDFGSLWTQTVNFLKELTCRSWVSLLCCVLARVAVRQAGTFWLASLE